MTSVVTGAVTSIVTAACRCGALAAVFSEARGMRRSVRYARDSSLVTNTAISSGKSRIRPSLITNHQYGHQ